MATAKVIRRSSPSRGGEGITAITVCGYKSIRREQRIEIAPLTLLAGANSSGKSSMMQPLLLLKQTLEATYDPGSLLLDGPNLRFTSADQLFSKAPRKGCGNTLSIALEARGGLDRTKLTFKKEARKGIEIESLETYSQDEPAERIHRKMTQDEIDKVLPPHLNRVRDDLQKQLKTELEWVVQRVRCFLAFGLQPKGDPTKTVHPWIGSPMGPLLSHIEDLIHVPGLRGNPERTYKTTSVGKSFPGTFEHYVASVISQWQVDNHSSKMKHLGEALEHLGLTWKVEAKRLDDTQVELCVGRLPRAARGGAFDLVSIADVGFGVSQSLPVVVALLAAQRGTIVYLEQPEIHLHPRAQYRMAKLLADAARRGVKVVAETHSSLVLNGIQTLVAKGELAPELARLYWFRRSEEDGATEVTSGAFDRDGAFGEWPEDFDDVTLGSAQEYLDAVERRGAGG